MGGFRTSPSSQARHREAAIRLGAEELGEDLDAHLAFVIAALEPRAAELGLAGEATPAADVAGDA